jgi:hypothetical protein
MPHAFVLVMLVQSSDANDASTDAAIEAARRAMGGDAIVKVTPFVDPPSDEQTKDLAMHVASPQDGNKAGPADAAVVLTWSDGHRRVHLHMLRVADGTFVDRDIGFDPRDAAKERGRTIGFAVASMMPEPSAFQEPIATQEPEATNGAATASADERHPVSPAPTFVPRTYRGSIAALGVGAIGIGGDGGGFGGGVQLEWYMNRWLGLRAGLSGRASEIGAVSGTLYTLGGSLGARARLAQRGPFELGLGADMLVLWEQLSHLDADDPNGPQHQSRFLPAFSLMGDVAWYFVDAASLVVGAGAEVAFGQTDLFVRGRDVATLVPVRAMGQLGFRVRF